MNIMNDGRVALACNGGELVASQLDFPPTKSAPVCAERYAAEHALSVSALIEQCQREIQAYRRGEPSNETYRLELLRRATVQGDQEAWVGFQQCFGELVLDWLHAHLQLKVACLLEREETYVELAFERFRQASLQQQRVFRTLDEALAYLRASLQGAILDRLRTSSRPGEAFLPKPVQDGEPYRAASLQLWQVLQSLLPDAREQRLAYLLYHCGLPPREIVRSCPQEWNVIQEIYRLRRNILERLLRHADQLVGESPGVLLIGLD
jgi:hypothetical protein